MGAENPTTQAANRLRAHTRPALRALGFPEEQITHGLKHAWQWGGCMICAECWHHTLPAEAYQICPLNLISEGRFNPRAWPTFLWPVFEALHAEPDEAKRHTLIATELARVSVHWLDTWNTVSEAEAHAQVVRWRTGLLMAYHRTETEKPGAKLE